VKAFENLLEIPNLVDVITFLKFGERRHTSFFFK
jgi:hypothetical protein